MSYCKYSVRNSPYHYSTQDKTKDYSKDSSKNINAVNSMHPNNRSINVKHIENSNFSGFDQIFVIPQDKRVKYSNPKETVATSKF